MNTLQLRGFIVLLLLGLGTNTAWSGQSSSATPATESHASMLTSATASSDRNDGAANEALPSIMNEEDIPAFLRTDPCDTGDS
jgi:hypothetical protein